MTNDEMLELFDFYVICDENASFINLTVYLRVAKINIKIKMRVSHYQMRKANLHFGVLNTPN